MPDFASDTAQEDQGDHGAATTHWSSLGTLQGSGINEEFLRHLEDGTCVHQPASHDSTLPPEGTEETWEPILAASRAEASHPPDLKLQTCSARDTSAAKSSRNRACSATSTLQRQQLSSPQDRQQERVTARRERQQQLTEAHNEWRWAERMQRAAMHRQRRNLEPNFRTVLQMHPSRRLPTLDGQIRHSIGTSFCPHRLASIYNLSIRYWDEGCVRLAARTLQGALQMLQQQGLWGGCVAHTWDSMEILRGSKQLRHAEATCAAPPHTDTKKELEEVRGHLGSLLCRASLRGYGSAVSKEAVRRCSRIKEALARVEDDLLLLQDLQARYSSPQSSEWGNDVQQRQLQRLVPLNLMPCMSKRINLQHYKRTAHGAPDCVNDCERWARTLHEVLIRQITARDYVAY
ncbi:hypothetical protein, conserved [Eimeria necatrix]|uniref:Uncharacterized protein n=1 Tax=Eimeria necatrix TaxID=51315 RepID=U6N362_9EIME|nr:hypothetical protein, conserved [Eimeria necatrix]CDJ68385.1 hypothetical protein, conserved [Eimeria necatrix]